MYQKGQIWRWKEKQVVIDDLWNYRIEDQSERRLMGKIREIEDGLISLETHLINFSEEEGHLTYISQVTVEELRESVTRAWHLNAPDTRSYDVCGMDEATHVVFSTEHSELVLENDFTPNLVYPITKDDESGDLQIVNDAFQMVIAFDLFIPCEYLKRSTKVITSNLHQENLGSSNKIVNLAAYRYQKTMNQ